MFVPLTPIRCLHRALDMFPHKIGIVSGDKQFTYREFGQRCQKLADGLRTEDIAAGDLPVILQIDGKSSQDNTTLNFGN